MQTNVFLSIILCNKAIFCTINRTIVVESVQGKKLFAKIQKKNGSPKNGYAVKLGIIDHANMIFKITSSFTFCIY